MDDVDDLYDLRAFDSLTGIDLTLWLRLLVAALLVLAVTGVALLAR